MLGLNRLRFYVVYFEINFLLSCSLMKSLLKVLIFFQLLITGPALLAGISSDSLGWALKPGYDSLKFSRLLTWGYEILPNQPDSALFFGRKVLTALKQYPGWRLKAEALGLIGSGHNGKANFDSSIFYFEACRKIFEENNYLRGVANMWNSLGNAYMGLGKNQKALEAYRASNHLALSHAEASSLLGIS